MTGEEPFPVGSTPSLSPAQTLIPLRDDRDDAEVQSKSSERNIVKEADGYTYIDWQDDDIHHPFNWSLRKKWLHTFVGLLFNAVTALNATGYSASIRQGAMELNTSREIMAIGTTAVSIQTFSFFKAQSDCSSLYAVHGPGGNCPTDPLAFE
jgi:hypothetical protein